MDNQLIIVGGGGHAKVIIDIFNEAKKFKIIGYTSKVKPDGDFVNEVPYLGSDVILKEYLNKGVKNVFVAIGDCKVRNNVFTDLTSEGFNIVNAVSKFARISPSVTLGKGIAVMPGAMINIDSVIKDNVIINTGVTIDHDNIINKSAHIAPGTNLAGNVTIGTGSFLGVGTNVIPGVKIGEWAIVGAGSVVIEDIPSYTTSVGAPSRVIKINK